MAAYVLKRDRALHSQARWANLVGTAVRTAQGGLCAFAHIRARSRTAGRLDADRVDRAQRAVCSEYAAIHVLSGAGQRHPAGSNHCRPEHLVSGDVPEARTAAGRSSKSDPAVASVAGFTGGRALNTANVFIQLKPLAERKLSATQVVGRLRPKLNAVSGARLFLQAAQDLRIGGRQSASEYQYTMTSDDSSALFTWVPKLVSSARQRTDRSDRR